MKQRLINIQEASEYLRIPVNTLYAWAKEGKIPSVKLGGLVRFDLQKINKWIEENSVQEKKFEHIMDKLRY